MLETKRLYLKNWEAEDAPAFFRLTQSPHVLPAAGCPPTKDEEAALQALHEDYSAKEEYKLVLKDSGEIIGSIGLRFGEDACSESFQAILRHAREDLRCPAVWGCHYEKNHRSARLLEKFGFASVRVNPQGDTRLGYTLPEAEMRLAF